MNTIGLGRQSLDVTLASSPVAPTNSSEQQCMQCHNVAAQITPGVSVIHAIVDKPFRQADLSFLILSVYALVLNCDSNGRLRLNGA